MRICQMNKVHALIDMHPDYLENTSKYHHMLTVTERLNVPAGCRYIKWHDSRYCVYTQPIVRHASPRIFGRYDNILSAIFHANGGRK